MLPVQWGNEQFELLPQRAVYWPSETAIIITDPHFGKAATFRRAGIPVPAGTTEAMLQRLATAIDRCHARQLFILGDFFHAKAGRAPECMQALENWFLSRPGLKCTLVRGNHDQHAGDPPEHWNIRCVDQHRITRRFSMVHQPSNNPRSRMMAGHIHPMVSLVDPIGASRRTPCFSFSDKLALLPAFGEFVGGHAIPATRGLRLFPVADDVVVEARVA